EGLGSWMGKPPAMAADHTPELCTQQVSFKLRDTGPMAPAPAPYPGRFPPSPTGSLHFGSLLAALGSWLFVRRAGVYGLVRIEDLDPPREVPGAARAQLRTLHAFGLVPDGEVMFQSTRGEAYQAALDRLVASGDAFTCHCSRADLAAAGGIHR